MFEGNRLDAVQSVFFKRQLEHIEQQAYEVKFPELMALQLVPLVAGIPEWARVYTWRMFEEFGSAKIIANMADDLPAADVKGTEASKVIKTVGASYGYDIDEIATAAQSSGTPLDVARATAARRAVDTQLDDLLSTGSSADGIEGLIDPTDAQTYTLADKDAGGKTWGTVGAPNATPDEIVADLMGIAEARVDATKGVFTKFTIVLPIAQYSLASQLKMGTGAETTSLKFALANSPYIEAVVPWYKLKNASGGGTTNRMLCFARNPEVVAGIVPRRFTPMQPQLRNLRYVINCTAKCGGIVLRYGAAFSKADGL
jgi:hypothetical protein